jgi:hypothetical protein
MAMPFSYILITIPLAMAAAAAVDRPARH